MMSRPCTHEPVCPEAGAPDRDAACSVAHAPEQGWALLCNGVLIFEDLGELLPSGEIVPPRRPLPHVPAARSPRRSASSSPYPSCCDQP
ncbi:DUF5999 family protein [Streptomyces sp. CBMA29]|uniref:DUF5999 family protein n=1 Tax=Streptomyces sp. CBMA29 TaxID=1896314 RepID=UPI003980C09B